MVTPIVVPVHNNSNVARGGEVGSRLVSSSSVVLLCTVYFVMSNPLTFGPASVVLVLYSTKG